MHFNRLTLAGFIGYNEIVNGAAIQHVKRQGGTAILAGYNADPNIFVAGDTYYIYPTQDGLANWDQKDFYVWRSSDLVKWTKSEKPILTFDQANTDPDIPKVPWANNNAWAPTIIERRGKYYFYFSGNNTAYTGIDGKEKTIGVAVGNSPTGPFTPQPKAMIYNNEAVKAEVAIDPATFLDPLSGKYYLFWGNGKSLFAELSDDMLSINEDTLTTTEFDNTFGDNAYFEAPFLVYRNGLYHFTYSIADTRNPDYRVGYATSRKIGGPYTSHGIIVQKEESKGILGTGHQSIFKVPNSEDWYICYHRFSIPNGSGTEREVTIDKLTFNADTGLINIIAPRVGGVPAQPIS